MKLVIVKLMMSSQNKIVGTLVLDEYRQETTFKYDQETRRKIGKVRMRYHTALYGGTLDFYGLRITRSEAIPEKLQIMRDCLSDLAEIDRGLTADLVVIPLESDSMVKGEMYSRIVDAIVYQIGNEVTDRIQKALEKGTMLPKVTKDALLKMLKGVREINVIDDPDVEKKIADIEKLVEGEAIAPLKEYIDREVGAVTSRWAYLEG